MKRKNVRTDDTTPDHAVASEEGFSLIRMPVWNKFHEHQEELIAIHNCNNEIHDPFLIAWPISEACTYCGRIAPEKIQTLFVLHNGHY